MQRILVEFLFGLQVCNNDISRCWGEIRGKRGYAEEVCVSVRGRRESQC
jgi:hypothetical protein